MSDEKAMPVYELATEVMACYGRQCAVQDAIALIEQDRATARAEGEAAGYRRAVEEIVAWIKTQLVGTYVTDWDEAIRAKFGGKTDA